MNEFAKMIYENWRNSDEHDDFTWGDYNKQWEKLIQILNPELEFEIESSINKCVWEVEQNAFIAGFEYACKCISAGKIEFAKVNN